MARDFPSIQQAFMPEPAMRPATAATPANWPTDPASFYAMLAGQSRVGETAAAPPPSANLAVPPVAIAAVPAAAMEMAPTPSAPGAAAAELDWNHIDRRERGHLIATGHVNPATKRDSQFFGADGFTFDDFVDIINPLHHVPLIGSLYRWATGDTNGSATASTRLRARPPSAMAFSSKASFARPSSTRGAAAIPRGTRSPTANGRACARLSRPGWTRRISMRPGGRSARSPGSGSPWPDVLA